MVGEVIDVSEHKTYLELTNRICYYNEPNLNNDMLPYDDTALEKAQTLLNMPVQGKYKVNEKGEPTFSGHELVKKKDGTIELKTNSIGTHINVWIEDDEVEINGTIKKLPCLFATYRIWRRYPNVVSAVKRLFSEGKLFSSWEIETYQYTYKMGIKEITDYAFLGNCLLGYEYAAPSYGKNAAALSLSQTKDYQVLIAEALSQDMANQNHELYQETEDMILDKNIRNTTNKSSTDVKDAINTITSSTQQIEGSIPNTDTAQLTSADLRNNIEQACTNKIDTWCAIHFWFPNENEVWCNYGNRKTELDYVKFTYEVSADDKVIVSEPEYVTLTVSVSQVNQTIAELTNKIESIQSDLDAKNNVIIKAGKTIQELQTQVAELEPYKEKVKEAEQKEIEAQIVAEKAKLKEKLLKGNLFTEEEIESPEIATLIESRNESAINAIIADKFIASIDSTGESNNSNLNTSTVTVGTANLETDDSDVNIRDFMKEILFNK